ncbi:hypothetical protein Agub_g7310 [Astrephomene gubernaculifera]|uniref:PUM-HD domain-containing protein n=1 Tax=Astrephomene gubernaculifera TaxID=47775 RepID=A0AAD3HLL4_9CHLO|nr:hypothetical protein Agub_g7310 [Astrephomene gubernaculifera]
MSEAIGDQGDEIRRILLSRHLDNVFSGTGGPKRPGSAPPQAEMLPGSPMGAGAPAYNLITGEPLRDGSNGAVTSGTQPPPQCRALDGNDLGLAPDAEEALRSQPDYVAYYYANVRNNPRLPPPLPARNVNAAWFENGKSLASDGLADAQAKPDAGDAQARATFNMLFGNFKDGAEPIPIRGADYIGQDFAQQASSSLGAASGISPPQPPDTLAAAWANVNSTKASSSATQQLLGAYGSPKPPTALSPLLTAELNAQASGISLYSAHSADEQTLHESLFVGSNPHTPMGSQHGGVNPLFGSFNPDSPRPPSLDAVGRSVSSNSLGAGTLGKDPKVNPAPGPAGRISSVIGDQRVTLRTPSKLRIGSTVADQDPQQQLLNSLTGADGAAAAAAAAAAACAAVDPENAAAAAAAAAAAQVQAAVEAFTNLPPAAATAFAAALGGGDQGGVPVNGQPLVAPEVLLGGAGAQQQQMQQAMYMAAAMYPMYYQQAQQTAGVQQSFQKAMQAAAMAGFPSMPGAAGGFPVIPGAVPPAMLQAAAFPPAMLGGLPPGAAALFSAGGVPDMAALAAAGLRPPQSFGAGALVPPFQPGMAMGMGGGAEYAAYYQKMMEAQAAAMAMAGGGVPKDADAAAALLRAGVPPPPPPHGQPPPPPKDKRGGSGDPAGPYGHPLSGAGGSGELGLRGRNNSIGREGDRLTPRSSGTIPPQGMGSPSGGGTSASGSPVTSSPFGAPGVGPAMHNSRLRSASGPQPYGAQQHDGHMMSLGSMGSGTLPSAGSLGQSGGQGYHRESRGPDGPPQRRNSIRRDALISEGAEPHSNGGNSSQGAGGSGRGPRSSGDTLLDEFKTNKTGRKWELREILGHVYEFSLDQHGSRFIQQKLEGVSSEDLDAAFSEVLPRIMHLMTDVFGNYVVQKFLEHGSPEQRARLTKALHGHVLQLSLQMYGCRVVQKALEVFSEEQKVELVAELDGHIMRCVRDQNGNHVIQKCIECVPAARIRGLLDNFLMCVVPLSTHPFGCRIIQRILEHVSDQQRRAAVMADILASAVQLTQDQYGNYVIQHVLEHGTPQERSSISGSLAATVVQLSMHKFASNVIEKCLTYGSTADRDLLINRMLGAQALQMQQAAAAGGVDADMEVEDPVQVMMKDQFGNYVVQKVLEVCSDDQREIMLARVRQQLHALKRYTYGKHIVARVEKLLSAGTRYQTHAKGRLLPDDEALAAAAAAAGRLNSLSITSPPPPPPPPPPPSAAEAWAGNPDSAAAHGRGGSTGSDGGGSAQPAAPNTPTVSAGTAEGGYSSNVVATTTASDEGAAPAAPQRPSSGVVGLDASVDGPAKAAN